MAQEPLVDLETDDLEKYFTDVEYLRGLFAAFIMAQELPRRVLAIHGVGGVGKSSLLRMFRLHAKSVHVPITLTSAEESKSEVDILSNWSSDLKADGITLGNFQKTLIHYKAIQAKVEDQVKKAQEARKKAAEKVGTAVAKAVIGAAISLIPGGAIVNALGGIGVDTLVDWLSSFLTKPDIDLLIDPTKALSKDFLEDLAKVARKHRLVLMLDTFEQMSTLNNWVCGIAKQLNVNILLVIAGREMLNWDKQWDGWLAHTQVEELNPMTEDIMRNLAHRYYATMVGGEPDPKQVEAIIAFARGLPMVLATSVRLWVKYGQKFDIEEHKAEVYGDVVRRLREGVPPELLPILEAAAIVRWFDRPILRAVTKLKEVSAAYEELRRFPFVKSRKEGLSLHDSVREIIEETLQVDDSDRHKELHKRAARYFEKLLKKATSEESENFELEQLYHYIRINEEAGIKLFQKIAEDLTRFYLINRLRKLLNDVSTYPLKRINSNLWRQYYTARLMHLEGQRLSAEEIYQLIGENELAESKLRAYSLCDWGVLIRERRIGKTEMVEKSLWCFERSLELAPLDSKLVLSLNQLGRIYRDQGHWEKALEYLNRVLRFYSDQGESHGIAHTYLAIYHYFAYLGDWQNMFHAHKQASQVQLGRIDSFTHAEILDSLAIAWVWAGRYSDVINNIQQSISIKQKLDMGSSIGDLRDIGLAMAFAGRHKEAKYYIDISLDKSIQITSYTQRETAVTMGFLGTALLRLGDVERAQDFLSKSLELKLSLEDTSYLLDTLIWLGMLFEEKNEFQQSKDYYRLCLDYRWSGRRYFECAALTGLVRINTSQGDYSSITSFLAEAEQLAQQYEYNDHLASLRLTQGHIAWEQEPSQFLKYYQYALIYALRYNRFLLDDVLGGRPQGTPLRPIIPFCFEHGEEGHKMLVALQEWWETGKNDVGTPRPETISPIPENIPLLEAEKIAREHEPGDGTPQKTVLEQLDAAIGTISNSKANTDIR